MTNKKEAHLATKAMGSLYTIGCVIALLESGNIQGGVCDDEISSMVKSAKKASIKLLNVHDRHLSNII